MNPNALSSNHSDSTIPNDHTAAPPVATENEAGDVEKALEKPAPGGPPAMPSFPEGGLMGWLCVGGATLVCK